MGDTIATTLKRELADIKQIPQDPAIRRDMRFAAAADAREGNTVSPLRREQLEQRARSLLARLSLPASYLGFAMVTVNNAAWLDAFAAVPFDQRLLLLPHCLSSRSACQGLDGSGGLQCAGCGGCSISSLQTHAQRLGYQVIVAEGTSPVLSQVLEGRADALLGVACMDSLARSFGRISELGIPQLAIPLLQDGCVDTVAELDYVETLLRLRGNHAPQPQRSFVPLLRQTSRFFHEPELSRLLEPAVELESLKPDSDAAMCLVERESIRWLQEGGKRLRPFLTVASFVVARHGLTALQRMDHGSLVPDSVGRLALAIESLHKASLVHDDIEDNDDFRYGHQAMHIRHGIGQAINIGDYLIGLGYRLAAAAGQEHDAACAGDIVARLAQAHQELCRGQAADLAWNTRPEQTQSPMDVLTAYALKTSPAFEAAIYCGLRAAGTGIAQDPLRRMCAALGQAFQIANDLEDWVADEQNKITAARDALCDRPTILRAFAVEAGCARELAVVRQGVQQAGAADLSPFVEQLRRVYSQSEAFARTEQLLHKLRERARQSAAEFPLPDLRELMQFIIGIVLPARNWPEFLA